MEEELTTLRVAIGRQARELTALRARVKELEAILTEHEIPFAKPPAPPQPAAGRPAPPPARGSEAPPPAAASVAPPLSSAPEAQQQQQTVATEERGQEQHPAGAESEESRPRRRDAIVDPGQAAPVWCATTKPSVEREPRGVIGRDAAAAPSSPAKSDVPFDPAMVCYVHCRGKEPSLSKYYLGRDKALREHVDALCKKFTIDRSESAKYALQLSGYVAEAGDRLLRVIPWNKHYLEPQEFDPPEHYVLPPDTTLTLSLHPVHFVDEILSVLRAEGAELTKRKMAVFRMRCKIVDDEDTEMLTEFIKQGGWRDLLSELQHDDTLPSYASILLGCLATVFSSDAFDQAQMSDEMLAVIAKNVVNINVQLQRPALDAYTALLRSSPYPYEHIMGPLIKAGEAGTSSIFSTVVNMVNSFDASVQQSALSLVNAMLRKAIKAGARDDLTAELDQSGIEEHIKNHVMANDPTLREELHDYQIARMDTVVADFNTATSEEGDVVDKLARGWSAMTKDSAFPGVISPMWCTVGFKTENPLKELENMLYLKNWLHHLEHHADHLRRVDAKGAAKFPYSSASIGVTSQLIKLFSINDQGRKHVFPLLLNCASVSGSVFGELHSLGIRQLATQWKNLKCTEASEIRKLIPMVKAIFEETIVYLRPESLSKLKLLMDKQARDVSMLSEVTKSGAGSKKKVSRATASFSLLGGKKRAAKVVEEKKPEVLLFGGDLVEIMEHERKEDSTATVPRLLTYLIESVFAKGGTKLEGVFRISAQMDILLEMKARLNQGEMELEFPNAHYPAALLKQFLRDLKNELIPQTLYDDCLAANQDPKAGVEILKRLDPDHYNVVKHLLSFMHEMGKPEYQAKTKMGYSNLALVFAPAFFRPDVTDHMGMLAKSDMERAFITSLLEKWTQLQL